MARISEVIIMLQNALEREGDLPVHIFTGSLREMPGRAQSPPLLLETSIAMSPVSAHGSFHEGVFTPERWFILSARWA